MHQIEASVPEQYRQLAEEVRAPEFNQFTVEMCRAAGFTPTVHEGTVESVRSRRPGRPGTLPVLRPLFLHLRAPRDHLAAAHRTSLLLPVVSAVARHRHLRPRAGHRQLRTNHVPATRLARRPKADGALTGPDTVRPVVNPCAGLSPQSVRSQNALCP
jgi:hypothetical protein